MKWGLNAKKFKYHAEALEMLVDPLSLARVSVYNLNHASKHSMFSFSSIDQMLVMEMMVA